MNKDVERIAFRMKDLLLVIGDKDLEMKVYLKDRGEIDYDQAEEYRNLYVVDVGIVMEDDKPLLQITLNESIEIIYFPNNLDISN